MKRRCKTHKSTNPKGCQRPWSAQTASNEKTKTVGEKHHDIASFRAIWPNSESNKNA